jgi:hypothetical protein
LEIYDNSDYEFYKEKDSDLITIFIGNEFVCEDNSVEDVEKFLLSFSDNRK